MQSFNITGVIMLAPCFAGTQSNFCDLAERFWYMFLLTNVKISC